jgi:putative effector of murein hydrolase
MTELSRFDGMQTVVFHLLTGIAPASGLTILVYGAVNRLHGDWRLPAAVHPVLVTATIISAFLVAFDVPYSLYLSATAPIHRSLPLLFVILAVPLWRDGHTVVAQWQALAVTILCGAAISVGSAVLAALSVAQPELIGVLSVKSTPTAAALEFVGLTGGPVGLTVVLVVLTGIAGTSLCSTVFRFAGVTDERAQGLALGLAASALGIARAFRISPVAGGFASVGMILNSFATLALASLAVASPSGLPGP